MKDRSSLVLRRRFQKTIWDYYKTHRRQMPWREDYSPYAVFVSEVMLQQTQVARVVPKFLLFLKTFPTFEALAKSSTPELFRVWQGLGYNRRALALRTAARVIVEKYKGKLPQTLEELDALPGIGPATAASIYVYAYNKPAPFIETNVRTVYIHSFFATARKKISDAMLLPLVEDTLDVKKPREWFYALMDYGAMLKSSVGNLSKKSSSYMKQSVFKGSLRELRGKCLRFLGAHTEIQEAHLPALLNDSPERTAFVLTTLENEGFLYRNKGLVSLRHE